jgi:hypothetical protein
MVDRGKLRRDDRVVDLDCFESCLHSSCITLQFQGYGNATSFLERHMLIVMLIVNNLGSKPNAYVTGGNVSRRAIYETEYFAMLAAPRMREISAPELHYN